MSIKKVTEQLRFAGEVVIRHVEINAPNGVYVDVTNQIAEINVYEDIYSPFMTLSIVLRESQDFLTCLPLQGEEVLNLEIATPGFAKREQIIKGKFYIYKLSDRVELNKRSTVYTLHAISIEAIYDLNSRLSKSFRGKISDIAKSILGKDGLDTDKNVNVEETINTSKYVSNFWSPVKNLNYLCTLARNVNQSPTYLFYENRYGFNFLSMEALYISDVYQKFQKDDYSATTDDRGFVQKDFNKDYNKILDFRVKSSFDSLRNIPDGTYASRMHTYDLVRKKYTITDYKAAEVFDRQKHLNKNPSFTDNRPASQLSTMFNQVKHYGIHDGFPDVSITKNLQERISSTNILNSNTVEITVLGRTDYTVGQKVHITIPRPAPVSTKDTRDTVESNYTGYYVITAARHAISREKHEVTFELARESQ